MIYVSREKLTCYVMDRQCDEVHFDDLRKILTERPSNFVYCEKDGKLYGIISMGDVARAYRAGNDYVVVNRRFTNIRPFEYMRAKQIFKENDKINALPVMNTLGEKLIGAYLRWDDLLAINDLGQLNSNQYAMDFWTGKRIVALITPWKKLALVKPCEEIPEKQELMQSWKDYFLSVGVQVSVINREEIGNTFDAVEYILFTDEDEKRGTEALCKFILKESFNPHKVRTFAEMREKLEQAVREVIGDVVGDKVGDVVLKDIRENDIYVYTLTYEDNGTDYWKSLQNGIADKFSIIGKIEEDILYKEWEREFFAELYSEEYAEKIRTINLSQIHRDGITRLKDADTEVYHVEDGERRTLGQPDNFRKCIYFYGPCVIVGARTTDEYTIESFLQTKLNDRGYNVKCVNNGAFSDQLTELHRVVSTELKKGDIIILFNWNKKYEGIPNINLTDICEKHNVPVTWMTNSPLHSNHKLNSLYADEIFETIEPVLQENLNRGSVKLKRDFVTLRYLERYFCGFSETHNGINGSIVMNCNPFTRGHRYLIEQALKQVDHLIIFVVEEDRSLFTFRERFAMVVEGTKDLENVTVVPSGDFILSQTTFPEYFLKMEDEDIVYNVEYDVTLFAEQIAPRLNITYRFVGEELEDKVTNEYNEAMKRILPKYGINIVEIPRAKTNGKVISASRVRKDMLDGACSDMDKLVPQTTKRILGINGE